MLKMSHLSLSVRGKLLLNDIHFHLQAETCACILGPSGGGKTLFLKLIAGLLRSQTGSLKIKTQSISMLFQHNAIFDSMSVAENLSFPLKERLGISGTEAKKKVNSLLNEVGLFSHANSNTSELSGGMRKRLGLARALIVEPKLLLIDEPFSGLDPLTAKQIGQLILKLKKEQSLSIVSVTNDFWRMSELADEVYLLLPGGPLLAAGSPENFFKSQDHLLKSFRQGRSIPETQDRAEFEKSSSPNQIR